MARDEEPIKDIIGLNKLLHEPARLGILSFLLQSGEADFVWLSTVTGLSRGNLTTHLGKLEKGGLISTERVIRRRKPQTKVMLTQKGEEDIKAYWEYMNSFTEHLGTWTETSLHESRMKHLREVYGG